MIDFNNTRRRPAVLQKQITLFTWLARVSTIAGLVVGIWGWAKIGSSSTDELKDLGTFWQGAVGPLWSLSAIFFVYVAFLGQRLQLMVQQDQLSLLQAQISAQDKDFKHSAANQHHIIRIMDSQARALKAMAQYNAITQMIQGYETILTDLKNQEARQGYIERVSLHIEELERKRFRRVIQLERILSDLEVLPDEQSPPRACHGLLAKRD